MTDRELLLKLAILLSEERTFEDPNDQGPFGTYDPARHAEDLGEQIADAWKLIEDHVKPRTRSERERDFHRGQPSYQDAED